jgi:hypothetical protein
MKPYILRYRAIGNIGRTFSTHTSWKCSKKHFTYHALVGEVPLVSKNTLKFELIIIPEGNVHMVWGTLLVAQLVEALCCNPRIAGSLPDGIIGIFSLI